MWRYNLSIYHPWTSLIVLVKIFGKSFFVIQNESNLSAKTRQIDQKLLWISST